MECAFHFITGPILGWWTFVIVRIPLCTLYRHDAYPHTEADKGRTMKAYYLVNTKPALPNSGRPSISVLEEYAPAVFYYGGKEHIDRLDRRETNLCGTRVRSKPFLSWQSTARGLQCIRQQGYQP